MSKNDFGQYFTPRHVADLMVDMLKSPPSAQVLEPSAGEGVFLDALEEKGYKNTLGLEIDERLAQEPQHHIVNTSFVSWEPEKKVDAIIGNPPYIRWKNLDLPLQDELKQHPLWGTLFNPLSDYLNVFIANSIEHLLPGGELIFITPSFWMHTKHAEPLREWMFSQGAITDIISFGESEVFPKVASAIVIFRFEKGKKATEEINFSQYIGGRKIPTPISLSDTGFKHGKIPPFKGRSHWTLADAETQERVALLEQMASKSAQDSLFGAGEITRLGDYVDVANGMVSGLDKAFKLTPEELDSLNQTERNVVLKVAKAKDLSFLAKQSISYYFDIPGGLSEDEFHDSYPVIWDKLQPFKNQLLKRYSYGKDLPYWQWAFKRSERFITSPIPKIFVPCKERMTNRETARFAYVEGGVVATQDVTAIAPKANIRESTEYILAYLSTVQVSEWIRVKGLMKGGIAEFSEKPINNIPFRTIDWDMPEEVDFHNRITNMVQEVMDGSLADRQEAIAHFSNMFKRLA